MSKVYYSISDRSLTFYVEGNPYSIDRSSPAWDELKALVQTANPDVAQLIRLTNPIEAIKAAVESVEQADYLPKGVVGVTRDGVTYNGEPLRGVLVDRILDMLSEGFDIMPMIRFTENLLTNPAQFAQDELYLWLENSDLPITEDGHFLAYKSVRHDFKSHHGGVVDNTPGTIVSMPRQDVDPIRAHTCSTGLHFCSKSYLPAAYNLSDGVIVLLKINPADVVSIPSDYGNTKGRAWKYEVLHTVDFDIDHKWAAVYTEPTPDVEPESDMVEPEDDMLRFPSNLASALFAALNEIGVSTKTEDREARLDWANWALYNLVSDFFQSDFVGSFHDLTVEQATILLERARSTKEDLDAHAEAEAEEAAEAAQDAAEEAEAARVAAINSYGIESLRRKASKAGLANAYKGGFKVADLRAYLIGHPSKPV